MADFDWVSARSKCSLVGIFEDLKAQVAEDVKKRNELEPHFRYEITLNPTRISVYRETATGLPGSGVVFILDESAIQITDSKESAAMFRGTPTISDDGKCRLKVNGQERELWQFRKIALEELFFGR